VDDVTIYSDDALFYVYYLIPDAPGVRLDADGHPVFLLVKYEFSAEDRAANPNLPKGGGYLNFDTALAVTDESVAKIRTQLQADVDAEWNRRRAGTPAEQASMGVAGTTQPPPVRFDTPTWTAGKVGVDAPQTDSLITARVSEGTPSLLQGDTAVFNLDLTPAGATFMEKTLSGPDGGGATDLTPIQVAYDLSFWARLPAATIVVHADSSRIHEYVHQQMIGRGIDWCTTYDFDHTDLTTDTVTASGAITVQIDQGSGSLPDAVLNDLRDYALDLVKQMITSSFFSADPPDGHHDDAAPNPNAGYTQKWYLREYDAITMNLDVTLEQRSVVEWQIHPQATLESFFQGMSASELSHYIRKISLDDPFWRTLDVDVRAFADWKGPVSWVRVDLDYAGGAPPGGLPHTDSFTFDENNTAPQQWTQNITHGDVSFRYRTTIAFDGLDAPDPSDWTTTSVPAVNVQATAPTLSITVLAGDIDFDTVQRVEVVLAYEDADGGVPREEHTIVLTSSAPEGSYERVIYKPITKQAMYRTRFTLTSGDVQEDREWHPVGGPQLVINADRSSVLRVGLLPAGDGWADVVRVMVDLSYTDEANNYRVSNTINLESLTQFKTWTVPLKNPAIRAYRYRWTASFSNGHLTTTDWQDAPAGTETLPIAIHRPGLNVTLVPDAIDFAFTPIVEVTCRYDAVGIKREETFVFRGAGAQTWSVDVPEGAPTDFTVLVTYNVAGGQAVTLDPIHEHSTVVVLPAYNAGQNAVTIAILGTLVDFQATPMVGVDTTYIDEPHGVHLDGSFLLSAETPTASWLIHPVDPTAKEFSYTVSYYTPDGTSHQQAVKHDTVPRIIVPKFVA
jgi:hypothetical protein